MQALWGWAAASFVVAAIAALMDWRDKHRRDYDRVALMPWPLLQVLGLLAAVMLAGAALVLR